MSKLLLIGTGGFFGALARYFLSGLLHRISSSLFPIGTLGVNLVGCFFIGAVLSLALDHGGIGPSGRLFLAIGFLGSFTTFSTFAYETVELLSDGDWPFAFLNIAAQLVLGIAAVFAGRFAIRLWH